MSIYGSRGQDLHIYRIFKPYIFASPIFVYSVYLPHRILLDFPPVTSLASLPLLMLWHRPTTISLPTLTVISWRKLGLKNLVSKDLLSFWEYQVMKFAKLSFLLLFTIKFRFPRNKSILSFIYIFRIQKCIYYKTW